MSRVDLPSFASSSKNWSNFSNIFFLVEVIKKIILTKNVRLTYYSSMKKKIQRDLDDFRQFTLKVQFLYIAPSWQSLAEHPSTLKSGRMANFVSPFEKWGPRRCHSRPSWPNIQQSAVFLLMTLVASHGFLLIFKVNCINFVKFNQKITKTKFFFYRGLLDK